MSQHRINPKAGWDRGDGPRGPNGRRLCRQCQAEVPKRQRTFCSEACVHEWKIRSDPGYVRDLVKARDHGVCAGCGLDTEKLHQEGLVLNYTVRRRFFEAHGFKPDALYAGDFWQADHIIEVVNGGGQTGLENYQTLCTLCHKAKTRRLAAERAEQRKIAAEQAKMSLFAGIES